MRFRNLDLVLIIIIVAMNVVWTLMAIHFVLVGIILALPLIFYFPGYALTQTLFRKKEREQGTSMFTDLATQPELKIGHPVGRTDQLVLSLGLSMAIDVLVGFLLNILPIGLNALSWILSLGFITIICVVLTIFLRRKDVAKGAGTRTRIHLRLQDYLLLGLVLLVVTSALWLSFVRPVQPDPSFTQFWMLPANQASKSCVVSVGIQSFESTSQTYRVVIMANSTQTNAWSSIALAPQQKWVQSVAIAPGAVSSVLIEAQLYRNDRPDTAYRDVHLTFYISSANANGHLQQQCVLGT